MCHEIMEFIQIPLNQSRQDVCTRTGVFIAPSSECACVVILQGFYCTVNVSGSGHGWIILEEVHGSVSFQSLQACSVHSTSVGVFMCI